MEYSFIEINSKKIMIYTTTTYEEKERCLSKLMEEWGLFYIYVSNERDAIGFVPSSAGSMIPKGNISKENESDVLVSSTSDSSINELSKDIGKENDKEVDNDGKNVLT